MSNILDLDQIKSLKKSGQILKTSLDRVVAEIKPEISTAWLDEVAETTIRSLGGRPSFKGYFVYGIGNFPSSLCVSINEEIVHGIPSTRRLLKEGDIVSLDLGVEYEDIYTDMAVTVPVGKVSKEAEKLMQVTKEALIKGIEQARDGNHIGDIGHAIESYVVQFGYGIIRDYVGHGIGTSAHTAPQIPNFGQKGQGPTISENEALAIEPMITLGGHETEIGFDRWVVMTADKSLAAHFEHTVLIQNGKAVIVTS